MTVGKVARHSDGCYVINLFRQANFITRSRRRAGMPALIGKIITDTLSESDGSPGFAQYSINNYGLAFHSG